MTIVIGLIVLGFAIGGGYVAGATRNRKRKALHEPRAVRLLDAPHISPCLRCGADNDLCRLMRNTPAGYFSFCRPKNIAHEYQRPVPTSMPGPPERRRG